MLKDNRYEGISSIRGTPQLRLKLERSGMDLALTVTVLRGGGVPEPPKIMVPPSLREFRQTRNAELFSLSRNYQNAYFRYFEKNCFLYAVCVRLRCELPFVLLNALRLPDDSLVRRKYVGDLTRRQ
jgi:hypothetical protein